MAIHRKILLRPARLKPGDTIGIVAPASPFDMDKFDRGVAVLKSMGFHVFVPDELFERKGYLAGSDRHRANLIIRLFTDPEIKAVFCARGGFGSMKVLSLLDFDSIRKNPKIFVGFSDISALLLSFYMKCGLVAFHGPMITTLGSATKKTREAMLSAISSGKRLETIPEKGVSLKPGCASGPVSGGNLTTLCHLVGTSFAFNLKGHILFLEDRGEASYRIDRMLTQMKIAGCFNGLAGLALGSFKGCGKEKEIFEIFTSLFEKDTIPILAGFDIGHGRNNLTIPLGPEATLDADRKVLSFHEPATAP